MERELFENMPIKKAYLKLSLPVVLAMVLSVVYNMVDTWFISLTKDTDLVAGVSICAPIFILSIAMGDIFGLGGRRRGRSRIIILYVFCICAGYRLHAHNAAFQRSDTESPGSK